MKILKSVSYALMAATMALSTSCLNNEPEGVHTWTATLAPSVNFTAVQNLENGLWQTFDGSTINFLYDFDAMTLQMTVSNMRISSELLLTFTLPPLMYNVQSDGAYVMKQQGPFTVMGSNGTSYQISDVYSFVRTPSNAPSYLEVNFKINDKYQIMVTPTYNYFGGTTNIEYPNAGNNSTTGMPPYSTQLTYYNLALNHKTMTADLYLFQANFAAAMPQMDMVFKSVPFSFNETGAIEFESDSFIPDVITNYESNGTISSRPEPNFAITDLSGDMVLAKSMKFKFTCRMGTASFSGTPLNALPSAN